MFRPFMPKEIRGVDVQRFTSLKDKHFMREDGPYRKSKGAFTSRDKNAVEPITANFD